MKLLFDKSFHKDIQRINEKKIAQDIRNAIQEFEQAKNIFEITRIKKITGYTSYYRKRIGYFRLGFKYIDDTLVLIRFLHRKDIYKSFP